MLEERIEALITSVDALADAINNLTDLTEKAVAAGGATPEPKKPGRKPKTEKPTPKAELPEDKTVPKATHDYEKDVKPLLIRVGNEISQKAMLGVISDFGVTKAPEIDPQAYPDVIKKCHELLDGQGDAGDDEDDVL